MKLNLGLLGLLVLPVVFGMLMLSSYQQAENAEKPSSTAVNKVYQLNKDKTYSIAGEVFDISQIDIAERLEREIIVNSYWHSSTIVNLKRKGRYFPTISKVLKENGVPDDLKYLAVAESNLDYVVSPAGAVGIWQFMPAAARELGLEVTKQVDERYHLEKSTEAFCKRIQSDKDKLGGWINALIAYNMGRSATLKAMSKQGASHFFELNLNAETMRYPFRIMAIKEIYENPDEYGFPQEEIEPYTPYKTKKVEVNKTISSLSDFAKKYDMNYRDLKRLNPWLRDNNLIVKEGKSYELLVE